MMSAEKAIRQLCKFCNNVMPFMTSPRRLPCGHTFCEPCLLSNTPSACPTCEKILPADLVVSELPLDFGPDYSCGPCKRKDRAALAKLFCRECSQRLCDTHIEVSQYRKFHQTFDRDLLVNHVDDYINGASGKLLGMPMVCHACSTQFHYLLCTALLIPMSGFPVVPKNLWIIGGQQARWLILM